MGTINFRTPQLDPLGAITADQLKEIKQWGTVDLANGTGGHWQKPTTDALLNSDPDGGRTYSFGANTASYQYKGDLSTVYGILSQFPSSPNVPGARGVDITLTQNGEPLADISVSVHEIQMNARGSTQKEEADFGSDGEGNSDYDDWSMQKQKELVNDKWSLEWEDTKNWMPFSWFGKQLIDPWTLAAYKMLAEGKLLGDIVTMSVNGADKTDELKSFTQVSDWSKEYGAQGWSMVELNPISVGSTAYKKLWDQKVLILKHTWSEEWVVSKRKFEKMKEAEEDLTPEQKQKYQDKMGKNGLIVSTEGRGNNDGPVENGEKTSKTYTITRTFTWKRPYEPGMKSLIPHGLKLVEPPKDPEP